MGGWILYAAVYFAFGWAAAAWQAWALFAVYGIFYGMTEGTEKALVADIVPTHAARLGIWLVQPRDRAGRAARPRLFSADLGPRWRADAFVFGASLALIAALSHGVRRSLHSARRK